MLTPLCVAVLLVQAQVRERPAARTLAAWLEAFNSGERGRLKAFLDVHAPKRELERELEFCEETGGFDLVRILSSAPAEMTALVRSRELGHYVELALRVEPEPPHRIVSLR
ncbi:MAG: hypothetical protein RMI94_05930 [Bryobacterales bacterium]|nr:hypothetical protein [Bryobacterales bacterium]